MKVDFRQLMVGYKSAKNLLNGTHSFIVHRPEMIYAILVLCLLGSCWPAMAQQGQKVEKDSLAKDQNTRLAGIYVKDGNENGQLRFLASGLTSSSSSSSSNSGLNSALNQYITNKQDMLEQLRPTSDTTTTGGVTGTTGTATGTTTSGSGSDLVTTTSQGAIYVHLGNSGSSSSSSSSSSTNAAINQVIYGSSPVAGLLPQIVGQAVSSRVRPGGQNNRRRVPARRRRVNKRRGSINNNQRRRRRGNKRGKNKAQVMVVRPNRG
ncbi:uncharacterized protein LOC120456543 [Drosophila santomea]|uniref:uncharacterized protein LOC120456543 n=1 Tax=Drosophila santomea TaxID=129105 RepID=UPI00195430FA|nr:uncharacterized protein LOC120456543 [Drosophila santomea]